MKNKKLITAVVALATLGLVASTGTVARAADKTLKLELISKGETHQFWQAVKKGAVDQAAKMNATVHFQGPASETMIDKQLEMLDAAIATAPDAIGYAALGTTESCSHLAAANKAGIPVYMFDTAAKCGGTLGTASTTALGVAYTDSLGAGKLAADKMGALIGGKGKVFVIGHSQTNQTGIDRVAGFVNEIKAKFKGITLLPVQYAEGGDNQKAQDIVSTVLVSNKDLKGVYGTNEGVAEGAAEMPWTHAYASHSCNFLGAYE